MNWSLRINKILEKSSMFLDLFILLRLINLKIKTYIIQINFFVTRNGKYLNGIIIYSKIFLKQRYIKTNWRRIQLNRNNIL